ncbi:uncharacterized protein BXZ73DRAFT_101882 [Epithele typhae]|uniref:uncharacterized protein n=1 Tax=Epithele typhae TaxID=378194 RepID=UPI00200785F5|nr:uncharacterized protein BXZ73DRAFT_101882 [Epithele typhae]KAH9930512.1 hypothetical protein BXZ73DRAFT_101882 [Epithele typhae]
MATLQKDFCPNVLYGPGCQDSSCELEHDARLCEVCVAVCSPESRWAVHERGPRHQANVEQTSQLETLPASLKRDSWREHLGSDGHRKHLRLAALRAAYEQAEQDKQGIVVSHADASGIDFGLVPLDQATAGVDASVDVSTEVYKEISLVGTEVKSRIPNHAAMFKVIADDESSVAVTPARPLKFKVHFNHGQLGRYEARLEFTFQGTRGQPFVIARRLLVVVGEADERALLRPVAPYERRRRGKWVNDLEVRSGEAPNRPRTKWARELPHFPIPSQLVDVLKDGTREDATAQLAEKCFNEDLSMDNYVFFFQTLLWIEEDRTINDLRMYDMVDVDFNVKEGRLYALHVHGLSEKRPSVVVGDNIMVQSTGGNESFKGLVHGIRAEQIYVNFHESFQPLGKRFHVDFS